MLQNLGFRRWGGRIALLAVWIQFALSFGHMHPEDVFGRLGHAVVQGEHATQVTVDRQVPVPALPGNQNPAADPDGCAICSAVHLTSTTLLPDAVLLPVPTETRLARHSAYVAFVLTSAPFLLFRTRAPPIL